MPTRTEVIQALRARDEFQNRDIALILDYLEQEAASSSGTRDTILRSRRRIQDEVTPRDVGMVYDYIAELGTPASTRVAFLNLLRRRDIVSRALVNFILDEIDATSFLSLPGGDPLLWYDFTDIDTLFQDTAGTMPVTANGHTIARVNNKGTSGINLDDSNGGIVGPIYTVASLNSLPGARFSGTHGLIGTTGEADPGDEAMTLLIGQLHTPGQVIAGVIARMIAQNYMSMTAGTTSLSLTAQAGKPTQSILHSDGDLDFAGWAEAGLTEGAVSLNAVSGEDRQTKAPDGGGDTTSIGCTNSATSIVENLTVMEAVLWNSDRPTTGEMEAYVTAKYGLTWLA